MWGRAQICPGCNEKVKRGASLHAIGHVRRAGYGGTMEWELYDTCCGLDGGDFASSSVASTRYGDHLVRDHGLRD